MQIRSVTFLGPDFEELPMPQPSLPPSPLYFAGLGSRMLAVFVDFILMIALCVTLRILTASFQAAGLVPDVMSSIQFFGTFFIFLGYFSLSEMILQGKTPGKMLLGIQVVNNYGEKPSIGRVMIRNIGRVVDIVALGLGVAMIVKSKRQQRFGDWLAGTQVVRLPRVEGERPTNLPDLLQSWGLLEMKPQPFKQDIPPDLVARINSFTRKPQYMKNQTHNAHRNIQQHESDEPLSNASGAV